MLAADGLRGDDSTGLFCAEHDGDVHIAKEASNAYTFLGRSETASILNTILMRGALAVGHNRAATRGAIMDRNAHPFWVNDNIVLVQNGTWFGDHKTDTGKNTEVDTEAVAQIIAEEADIAKALGKINAAYALVWFNVETKTLHMIRNKERPLYVAMTKDDGMLFASEEHIINFGAARADLVLAEKPYLIEENVLISCVLVGGTWTLDNKKIKVRAPKAPKVEPIPPISQIGQAIKRAWRKPGDGKTSVNEQDRYAIHNYIHRCAFSDWHVKDEGLARKHQSEYYQKQTAYLEMVDFVQAEAGADPKQWHAVFAEVEGSKEDPGPLFYATFRNTEEKEMLDRINQPFVITKSLAGPIIQVLTDTQGKKEYITCIRIMEFRKDGDGKDELETALTRAAGTVH